MMSRRVEDASGNAQPYGIGEVGHQGLIHDEATGLTWNRDWVFHPRFGRFNQPDRFEYIDGMNRYEYVRSNPVNYTDPLGTIGARVTLGYVQELIDAGQYNMARDILRQYHNEGRIAFRNYVRTLNIAADTIDEVASHVGFSLGAVEPYNKCSRCCKDGKTYKAEVRGTEVRLGFKVGVSVKREWAQFSSEEDSLPPCPGEGGVRRGAVGSESER